MITTDYNPPYKFEFRITKTDVKKAIQAIINSNGYKLSESFQGVLDKVYNSIKFNSIKREYNDSNKNLESLSISYTICDIDVTFYKTMYPLMFCSEYQNTSSSDFVYTLMNTLLSILQTTKYITRVIDIDEF